MKEAARRALLGLPVVALQTGRVAGVVDEVVYDARQGVVTGIAVGRGGVARASGAQAPTPAFIPLGAIKGIGADAVTFEDVENSGAAPAEESSFRNDDASDQEGESPRLIGVPVVTDSGKPLGKVEDIVFDLETGVLRGFELSDGLIQDLVTGRTLLRVPAVYLLGRNAIVVTVPANGATSARSDTDEGLET